MADNAVVTFPRWYLNMPAIQATRPAWFLTTGAGIVATAPSWTLAGIGATVAQSLARPMWTLSATGEITAYNSSAILERPRWTVSGAGSNDNPFSLAVTRPMWTLSGEGGANIVTDRPRWTLTGAGYQVIPIVASLTRRPWTLDAAGVQIGSGTGNGNGNGASSSARPMWTLSAAGDLITPAALNATLRLWALSAAGTQTNLATGAVSFPAWRLDAEGYTPTAAIGTLTFPRWRPDASGPSEYAGTFRVWAINLGHHGVTEYVGLEPTGFAHIGDRYYMTTAEGLYLLGSGDKDDTIDIDAAVDFATSDFGSSFHKRFPRAYVSGRFHGPMEFHTILAESGRRKYLLVDNSNPGFVQRRVAVGRGPRSRYWQIGFANRQGADFTLAAIVVDSATDPRRIS